VPLFEALADEELESLISRVPRQHFKRHKVIFVEGEPCCWLYLVEAGSVQIFGSSRGAKL